MPATISCNCCRDPEKKSMFFSYVTGVLLAVAWWILIEAASTAAKFDAASVLQFHYYIPGVVGTVAFVFLNVLDMNTVKGESNDSPGTQLCAKILFFTTMAFVFAAPLFAVWILVSGYATVAGRHLWPGIAVLLQNVLICVSTLIFRFACVGVSDDGGVI